MNGKADHRIETRELGVVPADRMRPVFDGVDLAAGHGEVLGIAGTSGVGKTTLLAAISGLVPWHRPARVSGSVLVDGEPVDGLDPGQRAPLLATVLDRPESQLFLGTPHAELEAVAALHGRGGVDTVSAFGLGPLLDRSTATLSSGERQRVALAIGLAATPGVPVLLDEPSAHLDAEGVAALGEVLAEAAREGGCVLLAEQAGWRLGRAVRRWMSLGGGSLLPAGPPEPPAFPAPPAPPGREIVLRARGLRLERGGRRLVADGCLAIRRGEIVVLTGSNGAGKSVLARVLAGLERPTAGTVRRSGRVALMLPSDPLQLFEPTVAREAESTGARQEAVARVLRRHGLAALAARAPWTLSRGEQRRLVHAVLDLLRPAVTILDEPAQGLDPENLVRFVELLHRRAARGRACLLLTHREELGAAAHRRLAIRGGRIVEVT